VNRAVVVGSGSAGRRHAAALRRRCPDAPITVVRRPGSTTPADGLAELGVEIVDSVEEAARLEPDVAVVASPSPFHRRHAAALAAVGAQLLVEKPLAHEVADAIGLVDDVEATGRPVLVGYHLRWTDTVPRVRQLLLEGAVGAPTSFTLEVGQHLAQWRPESEPSATVTARAELGGGVLRELSHELDGARFLFGEVDRLRCTLQRDGAPTDGLVDTVAHLHLVMATGLTGAVHLDMVAPSPFRRWVVTGDHGRLTADLLNGRIHLTTRAGDRSTVSDTSGSQRDLAEDRLIEHLLEIAGGEAEPICTGDDGIAAALLVAAAEESDAAGREVTVDRLSATDGSPG